MRRVKKVDRVPLLKRALKEGIIDLAFLDSETSLCKAVVWGTGEQYVSEDNIVEESRVIMVQWMLESEGKPYHKTWDKEHNDGPAIEHLINHVLNKDNMIIIGHNHKKFDLKVLNNRAKDLNLLPIENSIRIDTLQSSRSAFKAVSHKLDYKSKMYGLGGKIVTKMQLWKDVLNDVPGSVHLMAKYGIKDITDLHTIFWKELPYYDNIPAELETILLGMKAKCLKCEEYKKPKYELERCKVKGKNGWLCLNCGGRFTL